MHPLGYLLQAGGLFHCCGAANRRAMTRSKQIAQILDQLCEVYDSSVANLRNGLNAYAASGVRPDRKARDEGCFAYPELRLEYDADVSPSTPTRAFARLNRPVFIPAVSPARRFSATISPPSSIIYPLIILYALGGHRRAKSLPLRSRRGEDSSSRASLGRAVALVPVDRAGPYRR